MGLIQQLGYVAFEVKDLDAWRKFGTNVLGFQISREESNGDFSLRMDSHKNRFFVTKGEADDLMVNGWQVEDRHALEEMVKRLKGSGSQVTFATDKELAYREVDGMIKFNDPSGIPTEIYYGGAKASTPFQSETVQNGFLAEEQGIGHSVCTTLDPKVSEEFYMKTMGFKLSDHIYLDLGEFKVNITFLHTNQRHHSFAFGAPLPKRMDHFMIQVNSLDDVGLAYDRAQKAGLEISQRIGRHSNDQMVSFYAMTPSAPIRFEYGWGAQEIDDETWEPVTYFHGSDWGHEFASPPQM